MIAMQNRRVWAAVVAGLVGFSALAVAPAGAGSPQVTDPEDDAYRYPSTPLGQPERKPSMPLLSNDVADVLSATFAPAAPIQSGHDGGYSVSVALAGPPDPKYNYLVGARFGAEGDCWLIHFLTPGETRKASAGCGEGDKYRSMGSFTGSRVTVQGRTVSATFSFRRFVLPPALKADSTLGPFFLLTCPSRGKDKWACPYEDYLDYAWSESTWSLE